MTGELPTSFAAVLLFFVFVVPGLAYELSLRGRVPSRVESAFVETARVLLVGAAATAVASGLLCVVRALRPGSLPDPGELIARGTGYAAVHPGLAASGLTSEVAAATALALLVAGLSQPPGSGGIRGSDLWYALLYEELPQGRHPRLVVALKSGGYRVEGVLHELNTHPEIDKRELVLRKVEFFQEDRAASPGPWPAPYVRLAIPGREIAWMAIAHAASGTTSPPPAAPPEPAAARLVRRLHRYQWQAASAFLVAGVALLLLAG